MTPDEQEAVQSLDNCRLLPGIWDKRFIRSLARQLEARPERSLTEKQLSQLARMVWRYRRQLPEKLVERWKVLRAAPPNWLDENQGNLEAVFAEDQRQFGEQDSRKPRDDDAVLGGSSPIPTTGVVLGSADQSKRLAPLFTLFNTKARPCNGGYMRLKLTDDVALLRSRRTDQLADIWVKVYGATAEGFLYDGQLIQPKGWKKAGILKHEGVLFGSGVRYEPAGASEDLRAIAFAALLKAVCLPK